jgi:hypothetical protein
MYRILTEPVTNLIRQQVCMYVYMYVCIICVFVYMYICICVCVVFDYTVYFSLTLYQHLTSIKPTSSI